ncbi:MAG: ParA family protein [Candidatus Omnitrophota bacterium]
MEEKKGKIIAVSNQKGGCGKTTTVVNLSGCIAAKGHKVLLIDLDPQAHATIGLGIESHTLEKSMYDMLINPSMNFKDVIINTPFKNLDIAPSNLTLSGAEIELVNTFGRENLLKDNLYNYNLTDEYRYILIDCPPSLSLLTVNALTAADYVLIPVQTHYFPLEGMKQLLNSIDLVKKKLNHNLEILGIVPTIFDKRTNIAREVLDGIREYFKDKVFNSVINMNVKLIEAPSAGKPITVYDPNSTGAKDYNNLCEEILNIA